MFINIATFFIQLKTKSKKLEVKMIHTQTIQSKTTTEFQNHKTSSNHHSEWKLLSANTYTPGCYNQPLTNLVKQFVLVCSADKPSQYIKL